MKLLKAAKIWIDYHEANSKKNTIRVYRGTISKFVKHFNGRDLDSINSDNILSFLNDLTNDRKQQTKKIRYSHLNAFFNFTRININPELKNPCDNPILKKIFRANIPSRCEILEKETVDEIIFRTLKIRNRLILELMARGGMRIGEVLKLRKCDIQDRKLILQEPKSGKEQEFVFIPQKVADRLKFYANSFCKQSTDSVFPISYEASRIMVLKAGNMVGIKLRPHDLRRHSATYASREGLPIEIVSKVILRHVNLSTTQRYLGKVSDTEAMRWIENLYG
jgi:integrase/recombinase XerD